MKTNKRGISLIVLVITVIVLSILAAVVIINISNTNIIQQTVNTTFKSDMANLKQMYELYIAGTLAKQHDFVRSEFNVPVGGAEFDDIFDGQLPEKYKDNLQIRNGKLEYKTEDETEHAIVKDLGMSIVTVLPATLQIGDVVSYTPTVAANASVTGVKYEVSNNAVVESTTSYTPGTLTWVYLGQDENGKSLLVSQSTAQAGKVALGGKAGWSDGPKKLDELCNSLYGNSNIGTVRNMNMEDIDRTLGYTGDKGGYFNASSLLVSTPEPRTVGDIVDELGIQDSTAPRELYANYYNYSATSYKDETTPEYKIIFKKGDGTSSMELYWLSSPVFSYYAMGYYVYNMRAVHEQYGFLLRGFVERTIEYAATYAWGIRPVVVLKNNVQIIDNNGTWELEVL